MFSGNANEGCQNTVILNDGFWPNINAGDFEKRRGVPAAQDSDRIVSALVNAISDVNKQLERLKVEYENKGYNKAEEVPAFPSVEGKNRIVIQYESAIFSRAKADLLPDFATVHQRKEGDHLADRSNEIKNELLAESERIIRSMCGLSRSSVCLL